VLNNVPILIVEDEPYIALELKALVEEAGGKVLGPVGSVHGALALLEMHVVAAALLDIQLSDGDVTPVARALVTRGIPVVFQSGTNPSPELRRVCPNGVVYKKPVAPELLVGKLAELTKE
jgi:CheY-like chemotaxis protein